MQMQKMFVAISRLIFGVVKLVILLGLFVGVMLAVADKDGKEMLVWMGGSGKEATVAGGEGAGEVKGEMTEMTVEADARPILIRKYLEKYKSPLLPYSDLIFKLSETYGFEYYWILAIGQQESNLCKKIPEESYNCWGYGIHKSGTLRFENYELALKSFAEYLKREYFDKGYDTAEKMMTKYCPSSNGSWAYGVNHFIEEIETGNF